MERAVNSMNDAYDDYVNAGAAFLESRAASGGLRTPESDAALQAFKDKLELFKASIDSADDLVLSAQRALISHFASPAFYEENDEDNNCAVTVPPPDNAGNSTAVPAVASESTTVSAVAVDSIPFPAVATSPHSPPPTSGAVASEESAE